MSDPLPEKSIKKTFSSTMWLETSILTTAASDLMWTLVCYQSLASPSQSWTGITLFFSSLVFSSHLFAFLLDHLRIKSLIRAPAFILWATIWVLSGFRILYFSDLPISFHNLVIIPIQSMTTNPGATAHFVTMLFILLAVWRSIVLANPEPGLDAPTSSFYLGLFAFIVITVTLPSALNGGTLVYFLTFLFLGLVSLASGRISGLGESAGGYLPQFKSVWLTWILGIVFVIVCLALLSGWLLNGPLAPFIALVLNLLYRTVLLVLIALGLPILMLIEWVITLFVGALDSDAFDSIARTIRNLEESIDELQADQRYNIQEVINILNRLQPWIIAIVIGLILIFATLTIINIQKKRKIKESDEVAATYLLPADQPGDKKPAKKRSWLDANRYLTAMRIRQTYMRLLDACDKLGIPRPVAFTPLEYLPVPVRLFPQHKEGVERITQAYIMVRYGEIPEDESEVEQILADWAEINSEFKQIRAQKRKNPS
jgi:hypothetical protein